MGPPQAALAVVVLLAAGAHRHHAEAAAQAVHGENAHGGPAGVDAAAEETDRLLASLQAQNSIKAANSAEDGKVWLGSWTVRVDPAAVSRVTLDALAERHGLEVIGTVGGLDDTFFLHRRCREDEDDRTHCRQRREEDSTLSIAAHPGVLEVSQQHEISRRRHAAIPELPESPVSAGAAGLPSSTRTRRFDWASGRVPNDPLFDQQWYYDNHKTASHDAEVLEVWRQGVIGSGVVVCIVDDGIEHDHTDLRDAYDAEASSDFNSNDDDPYPREDDPINNHGTRCSGVVAAQPNNNKCGVGVAHGARIGGIRMLDGPVSDVVEANSLGHHRQHVDIYSSSWGPNDDGRTVEGPGPLASQVFEDGVRLGRGGLGSIFLFASGNGGNKDDCNCDGYSNSIYTIAISALTENEGQPYYSENCAAALTSTYSSGGGRAIVTVDLHNRCHTGFSGTSAAAPLAAGILALVLEVRPDLTWRDIQHIVVHSAVKVANSDTDWHENSAGLWHSHKFGFGKMSATRLVARARGWTNVGPQIRVALPRQQSSSIQGRREGTAEQVVTAADVNGIGFLEHVQINVNLHLQASRSKLQVDVVCPDGTYSKVLSSRSADSARVGFTNWKFMTVRCWHTSPIGTWQVRVTNGASERATLTDFQLIIYGTTADPMASHGPNDGGDAGNPVTAPPTKPTLLPTSAPTTRAPSTAEPTPAPSTLSAAPTPGPTTAAPSPVPTPTPTTVAPSPAPTPMPSTAAPTTSTPTVPDATFSPTPAPTTTAPSSAAPTTAGPTAADPTVPPSAAPTPIPTTSGPTRPPTTPPTWPRPTFQWQTQAVLAETTPEPTTLDVKGPGVGTAAAVATELRVDDKGMSIHDTAVQTGALVGVTAALVLVAVAFAVRRVMNGQSYSPISSLANRLTGGGGPDPFGDEWDTSMTMSGGSPDWTDTMNISPGAFQRGQVDNAELAQLTTAEL